jgi:hypothetical protein
MLPFGVTIPATVPQRSDIPEGLVNYPVYSPYLLASYFCSSIYNRLVLGSYKSPLFRKPSRCVHVRVNCFNIIYLYWPYRCVFKLRDMCTHSNNTLLKKHTKMATCFDFFFYCRVGGYPTVGTAPYRLIVPPCFVSHLSLSGALRAQMS